LAETLWKIEGLRSGASAEAIDGGREIAIIKRVRHSKVKESNETKRTKSLKLGVAIEV
jgi:hypothetical protein